MSTIKITYQFKLPPDVEETHVLTFDEQTMLLITPNLPVSDWTRLDNHKCSHCPLNSETTPQCPVARNLESVATTFAMDKSITEADITVTTEQRQYFKHAQLQEGLQSIFGLIMATSGCPHLDFLRPMARFHLPFSSTTETIMRSISFYLMEQYFLVKDGQARQINLEGLDQRYDAISHVNHGIVNRIRTMTLGDANPNALVILNSVAQLLSFQLKHDQSTVRDAFNR